MSITYGADRAQAFSDEEWTGALRPRGITWLGLYIGGECSAGTDWSVERVHSLARAGALFLPLYVGVQTGRVCDHVVHGAAEGEAHGLDAASRLDLYRFDPTTAPLVFMDVEAETYADHPAETVGYARQWCAAVRGQHLRAGLYGSESFVQWMQQYRSEWDAAWIADWVGVGPSRDIDLRSAFVGVFGGTYPSAGLAWQYSGAASVPGLVAPADWNVADVEPAHVRADALAGDGAHEHEDGGGTDMTDEQAKALVQALEDLGDSIAIYLYRQATGRNVLTGLTGTDALDEANFHAQRMNERYGKKT